MKPLRFVLARTLKNMIIDAFRHPAKTVTYSIVGALLVMSAYFNITGRAVVVDNGYLDMRILHGIYIGLLSMVGIPLMLNGLKSGTTFFSMSDVNMMFVSPINPKRILVYGLIKKAAVVLLVIVCYLTYGKMAMTTFNLNDFQAFMLIAGLAIFFLMIQVYTLVIYSTSNGSDRRINVIKAFIFGCLAAMLGFIAVYVLIYGVDLEHIFQAMSHRALEFIPVIGWVKGAIFSLNNGEWLYFALFSGLILASLITCLVIFFSQDLDYYEDVLKNTETTYELKMSMKEGKVPTGARWKPKVGATGIKHGKGASAFFFKHAREASRKSRMIFINWNTAVIVFVSVVAAVVMRRFDINGMNFSRHTMTVKMTMGMACALCVYIQFFLNAYGDWNRELTKPYIYIVPASPLKKLIYASGLSVVKPVVDGFIAFTITGLIIGADLFTILVSALLYGSFGFVFTTTNILTDKFLGSVKNRGILIIVYVLIIFIQTLPSIIFCAVLLIFVTFLNLVVLGIPIAIWNVCSSVIVYYVCRNTLHDMDMD